MRTIIPLLIISFLACSASDSPPYRTGYTSSYPLVYSLNATSWLGERPFKGTLSRACTHLQFELGSDQRVWNEIISARPFPSVRCDARCSDMSLLRANLRRHRLLEGARFSKPLTCQWVVASSPDAISPYIWSPDEMMAAR